jgi:hypothetical protein
MPNMFDGARRRYYFDLGERIVWTFCQGFLAIWLMPVVVDVLNGDTQTLGTIWGSVADTSVLDKAAIGGLAAVLATFKGLTAKRVGAPTTAATLPAFDDTPRG